MLAIGLGTGRCGTVSLAELLDHQPGARVTHERRPLLPWEPDEALYRARLETFRSDEAALVGDVGPYYLPYAPWLLRDVDEVRLVCLQRDRDAVIGSFFARTGRRNHWTADHGSRWRADPEWDRCFPTYATDSKEEAIGRYWDEYYRRAGELARRHPARFRIFDMEAALNDRRGQERLLDFVGVPPEDRALQPGRRENRAPLVRRLKGWLRRHVLRW